MSRLFKFEIKRMKYKKIHIILPLIIISIGLVGIITGNAFNENLTSKVKMLNIFQAYTQFSFIFLGFVYIYLFTEDSIKGTDKYISQLGYSLAVQILFKSLILYAYTLIITTAFIIGYAISIHFTDLDYLILIVCSIAAALLFTITFACLMSIIFKKALDATNGNIEEAFDWLREKGIAKAAKKADRIAAEGLSAFVIDGNKAALVEVNSETDFVAKNAEFQELVNNVAKTIVANEPADLDAALKIELDGKDLATAIAEKSGKIGEKLSLRRFVVMTKADNEVFGAYSHMGGKITALVKIADSDEEKARDVAMHVAASAPQFIDRSAIPAEHIAKETEVLKKQALEENAKSAKPKPENIVEKMIAGRLNKELKAICLVDQEFVKNPDLTVAQFLGNGKIVEMARFMVGEGMEHKEEDFAAEVAAQMAAAKK